MSSPEPPPDGAASAAARRPTDDPDAFLIPRDELPPGWEARLSAGGEPAPARPAATVVLVRASAGGLETLLLRRPRRSAFAPDAWVFPGGAVDPADVEAGRSILGVDAAETWSRRLGAEPGAALGAVVAAVREAWEETGILLGSGPTERLAAARERLLAGEDLPGLVEARALRAAVDHLVYMAHWITPVLEPRRYDTRFFLAGVEPGSECRLQGEELVEARWLRPEVAVAAYAAGEARLLPPTVHTLLRLQGHRSLAGLVHVLAAEPVPVILPRMRVVEDGVLIEIGRTAG